MGRIAQGLAAAAGLLAAGLPAACSGGATDEHAQLVETCVAEGEKPATCACIVDAMQAELSPDLFKRSAVAVAREKRPVGEFILSLPDEEKMEFYRAEQAMEACDLSGVADG